MPQLDFANPLTTCQVVWGAMIFAVLYICCRVSPCQRSAR